MADFQHHAQELRHARHRSGPRAHQLTEPIQEPTPPMAVRVPHDLLRLQRWAGNRAATRLVVQRMSVATAKQNMATQGAMASLAAGFIQNHGQGSVTNAGATEIHGQRPNPPLLNTVIRNSTALIDGIKDSFFVDRPDHWTVSTANPIEIIQTRVRPEPGVLAGQPVAQPLPGVFEDYFEVSSGQVQLLQGVQVTPGELQATATAVGAYPSKNAVTNKKVAYKRKFMQKIREIRATQHAVDLAAWISHTFQRINNQPVPQQGLTLDAVNAIPPLSKNVEVFVSKHDGKIFHLHRIF